MLHEHSQACFSRALLQTSSVKKTNWPQQTTCPKTLVKLQVLKCFLSCRTAKKENLAVFFRMLQVQWSVRKHRKKPSGNERHSIFVFNRQSAMSNGVWAYESYDGHKTNDADEHLSKYSMSQVSFDLFVFCVANTESERIKSMWDDRQANERNEWRKMMKKQRRRRKKRTLEATLFTQNLCDQRPARNIVRADDGGGEDRWLKNSMCVCFCFSSSIYSMR